MRSNSSFNALICRTYESADMEQLPETKNRGWTKLAIRSAAAAAGVTLALAAVVSAIVQVTGKSYRLRQRASTTDD